MCFRFGPCFGSCSRQDYGRDRPSTPKQTHDGGQEGTRETSITAPTTRRRSTTSCTPPTRQGAIPTTTARGKITSSPVATDTLPYAQDKADETTKLPAWYNKFGDDASYTYTPRLNEAAADGTTPCVTTTTQPPLS